MLLACMGIST